MLLGEPYSLPSAPEGKDRQRTLLSSDRSTAFWTLQIWQLDSVIRSQWGLEQHVHGPDGLMTSTLIVLALHIALCVCFLNWCLYQMGNNKTVQLSVPTNVTNSTITKCICMSAFRWVTSVVTGPYGLMTLQGRILMTSQDHVRLVGSQGHLKIHLVRLQVMT